MKNSTLGDAEDHITLVAVRESSTRLVPEGSVLLVVRSGILKHTLPVAVTTREVALNQDLKALAPNLFVQPRYLLHVLKAFEPDILRHCTKSGTTVQNIDMDRLMRFEFPLAPIDEQSAIVEDIEKQFSRLDAGIAALKRAQANLKRYRASVLKAACEGRLVPTEHELAHQRSEQSATEQSSNPPTRCLQNSRSKAESSCFVNSRSDGTSNCLEGSGSDANPLTQSSAPSVLQSYESGAALLARILEERRKSWTGKGKYKEPTPPDTTNLPDLPEGWTWASVDQAASVSLGKMLDKSKHITGNKLQYLRNINVRWGHVSTDDLLEMFFKDEERSRYQVVPGDVLVCEGGEPGRSAIWKGPEPIMYQKALHRVRLFGDLLPIWIVFWLENLAKRGLLERWFTGSTIKHFTRESFICLPLPLPPLLEQTRIIAEVERRLSVVDQLEATIAANLTRATRLRQAILKKAFSQ